MSTRWLIALVLIIFMSPLLLATPLLYPLQMKVYEDGSLMSSGDLQVFIYDAATNGNKVYDSLTDYDDAIINGYVNIQLGSGSVSLDLNYNTYYYLDLQVNGEDLNFNGSNRQQFESNRGQVNWNRIVKSNSSLSDLTDRNISLLTLSSDFNSTFVKWIDANNSFLRTVDANQFFYTKTDANSIFVKQVDANVWYPRKSQDETITGNYTFNGNTFFNNGFGSGGVTIQDGTLYTQNLVLANDFNTATVTAVDLNGDFVPAIDNAFVLGQSTRRFRSIWGIDGNFTTLYASTLTVSSISSAISFTANATFSNALTDGNLSPISTTGKIAYSALPQSDLNGLYAKLSTSNTGDLNVSGFIKSTAGLICDNTSCYNISLLSTVSSLSDTNWQTSWSTLDTNLKSTYYTKTQIDTNFSNYTQTTDLNTAIGSSVILRQGNNISLLNNDTGFITSYVDTNCSVLRSCTNILYQADSNVWFVKQSDGNAWYAKAMDANSWFLLKTDANAFYPLRADVNIWTNQILSPYLLQSDANAFFVKQTDGNQWYALKSDVNLWANQLLVPYLLKTDANAFFVKQTDGNAWYAYQSDVNIWTTQLLVPYLSKLDANAFYPLKADVNTWGDQRYLPIGTTFSDTNWQTSWATFDANLRNSFLAYNSIRQNVDFNAKDITGVNRLAIDGYLDTPTIQSNSGYIAYGSSGSANYTHEFYGSVYTDTGYYGTWSGENLSLSQITGTSRRIPFGTGSGLTEDANLNYNSTSKTLYSYDFNTMRDANIGRDLNVVRDLNIYRNLGIRGGAIINGVPSNGTAFDINAGLGSSNVTGIRFTDNYTSFGTGFIWNRVSAGLAGQLNGSSSPYTSHTQTLFLVDDNSGTEIGSIKVVPNFSRQWGSSFGIYTKAANAPSGSSGARIYVDADGQVDINGTTPLSTFQVDGNTRLTGDLNLRPNDDFDDGTSFPIITFGKDTQSALCNSYPMTFSWNPTNATVELTDLEGNDCFGLEASSLYSTIYYDKSNASYYFYPASTGTSLNTRGAIRINDTALTTGSLLDLNGGSANFVNEYTGTGSASANYGVRIDLNDRYTNFSSANDTALVINASSGSSVSTTTGLRLTGNVTGATAPTFYGIRVDVNDGGGSTYGIISALGVNAGSNAYGIYANSLRSFAAHYSGKYAGVLIGRSILSLDANALPAADSSNVLTIGNTNAAANNAEASIIAGASGSSTLNFGDTADEDVGGLSYLHSNNSLTLFTNTSGGLTINSSGDINIRGTYRSSSNSAGLDQTISIYDHLIGGSHELIFEDGILVGYTDPGCFLAGTPILMANGFTKNIEDIKVGDQVASFDIEKSTIVNATVEKTVKPIVDHYFVLYFNDQTTLKVTGNHPIYVLEKGWSAIDVNLALKERPNEIINELKVGDEVKTVNGSKKVTGFIKISGNVQTYNFKTVESTHNYFANNSLAHNKCVAPGTLIDTPNGLIAVEKVKVGDIVFGNINGIKKVVQVIRTYEKVSSEPLKGKKLPNGSIVTNNHLIDVLGQKIKAELLELPDVLIESPVYDIETTSGNYYVNGTLTWFGG